MVKCPLCNFSLRWKSVYKANWLYSQVECNNCGTKSKITNVSRIIVTGLTVVPLVGLGLFFPPFDHTFLTILVAVLAAMIGSFCTPFLVKYKTVEEGKSVT